MWDPLTEAVVGEVIGGFIKRCFVAWPPWSPLSIAILGGVIGGFITGAVYVAVSFYLARAETNRRVEEERVKYLAKSATFLIMVYSSVRNNAAIIPESPVDVKIPSIQLSFSTEGVFRLVSFKDMFDLLADFPKGLSDRAAVPLNLGAELTEAVKLARNRTGEIIAAGWHKSRDWEAKDTADTEFVSRYGLVSVKRKQLLDAIDEVLPDLSKLAKQVDRGG